MPIQQLLLGKIIICGKKQTELQMLPFTEELLNAVLSAENFTLHLACGVSTIILILQMNAGNH